MQGMVRETITGSQWLSKVLELTSAQWWQLRFYFWRSPFLVFYYITFITVIRCQYFYYLKFPNYPVLFAVCSLLFLFTVCYLQFKIYSLLFAVCCLLIAVWCLLFAVCYLLFTNDIDLPPERTGTLPGFRWLWDNDVCHLSLPGALPVFRLSN